MGHLLSQVLDKQVEVHLPFGGFPGPKSCDKAHYKLPALMMYTVAAGRQSCSVLLACGSPSTGRGPLVSCAEGAAGVL